MVHYQNARVFCINPQGFILDLALLSIFINAWVKEEYRLIKFAYYMKLGTTADVFVGTD